MILRRPIALLLVLLALGMAGVPAAARPQDDDRPRQERNERPKPRFSLDQAIARAQKEYKARVVRAESRQEGERLFYVLRLLNDSGRVWTVRVDAATGGMQ